MRTARPPKFIPATFGSPPCICMIETTVFKRELHNKTRQKCFLFRTSHCFVLFLFAGLTDRKNTSHEQEVFVEEIIRHDGYIEATKQNDIALLRLNQTITFNEFARPICLPPSYGECTSQFGISTWMKDDNVKCTQYTTRV